MPNNNPDRTSFWNIILAYLQAIVGLIAAIAALLAIEPVRETLFRWMNPSFIVTLSEKDSLVSCWSLEGTPIFDNKKKNKGVINGNGGSFVSGKIGLGFKSGGRESAIVIQNLDLDLDVKKFTIAAWIKVDEFNPGSMAIVWKGTRGANISSPYSIGVQGNNSLSITDKAIVKNPGNPAEKLFVMIADGKKEQLVFSDSKLPKNKFIHIAFTLDGSNIKLYRNGKLAVQDEQEIIPLRNENDKLLQLGGIRESSNFFNGVIDEVKFFKRPLSESEIQSIMNRKC